ncbi:ectonucleoside triphosphate diphosphohydrolase 2 isoform X2 [Zalophus californianus]|uniref:Ectonucleoside triphosphate diphosphohydrolase 2 isoform X2 n=1 Tax=Zalophus californianus TaxID=9704 RepID=A0A6J2F1P6_ZALCA|nr:ectonucleoside triphosphate diphosphohydrolase 2 isoform X2 [Zalophus californianus]
MAGKVLSLLPPLLLAVAGLAGLLLLYVPTRDVRELPALKYGIVLDAGSSHTSMFIYKWPADKENDTGIVGQHSSCDVRGGGISSYADNPSRAGQSLVECLDQALQDVPKERHVGTPLYLGATAGMRLLNLTSPEASANVLAAVTQTLTQYPFDFRGAHILSGQDEGVFGWVTANYLLENFIKTHGFHPCWPRGYSTQVLLQDVYESPCTAAQRPQAFNNSTRVSLSGTSNPALCRSLIMGLFNFSSCRFSRCSFNGIFQPPVAGNFIAFSAFFYTMNFLRTVMGLPVATLQQLEAAVVTVCNQTWSELQSRAPGERARLPDYCAGAMFVQQLLSRGYGFHERAFGGVTFQKKVGAGGPGARRGGASPGCAGGLRPSPSPAGRGHRGRVGARLHAEPDQPDPRRAAGAAQGHRLRRLGRPCPALRRHASGRVRSAAAPGALGQVVGRHLGASWGRLPPPRLPAPPRPRPAPLPGPRRGRWRARPRGGRAARREPSPGPACRLQHPPASRVSRPSSSWGWGIQTPRSPQPVQGWVCRERS